MPLRILNEELQKKCQKELNEDPERIEEDLKHIREWITSQRHLMVRNEDQWLVSFLRGCKHSLQRTKEKLDKYYTVRTLLPEFYSNRDPFLPEIQAALAHGLTLPLPRLASPGGPRIILIRVGAVDPQTVTLITAVKSCMMLLDVLLNEDDNFVIGGQAALVDLAGMTFAHAIQVTPTTCQKTVVCLQDSYPSRPKNLNVTNAPALFKTIYDFVKKLVTQKIANRIHLHTQIDDLMKDVPISVLPKEYGGESGSIAELTDYWKKKVESYREWFLEDSRYRTDESRRVGNFNTSETLFGVAGSFRKLSLD